MLGELTIFQTQKSPLYGGLSVKCRGLMRMGVIRSLQKHFHFLGIAAYVVDGDVLEKLANVDVRLARWSDYASYLGNYSDSRNDFAKSSKINFNLGVQISDEDLKRRPIFFVAQTTGCLERNFDRFGNPPVSYSGYCEHLRSKLKLDNFLGDSPSVALVRRFR